MIDEYYYNFYCIHCRVWVSTYSPVGTHCDCGRIQADWMRANVVELNARFERGNKHVQRYLLNEPKVN